MVQLFNIHALNCSAELCRCQVFSGVKWPPYSPSLLTTLSGNQQSIELPQIHSPQTRLTVQKGDTIQLPCKVHNLGKIKFYFYALSFSLPYSEIFSSYKFIAYNFAILTTTEVHVSMQLKIIIDFKLLLSRVCEINFNHPSPASRINHRFQL